MKTEIAHVRWGLWLQWILATIMGFVVGLTVGGPIALIAGWLTGGILAFPMLGVMIATPVGLVQWLVLRQQIPRVGWWVLASITGAAVGGFVVDAIVWVWPFVDAILRRHAAIVIVENWVVGYWVSNVVQMAAFGASVGIIQWLVLRRHVYKAEWWILASTIAWSLAWNLGDAVHWFMPETQWNPVVLPVVGRVTAASVVSLPLRGTVVGAITGILLVWLLRCPIHKAAS